MANIEPIVQGTFGIRYIIQVLIGFFASIIYFTGDVNSLQSCDLYSGKWVYDNKSIPLYKEKECPYVGEGFACEKYGRKEFKFRNWRWQPRDCDLPRFKAKAFLERIRGKRLVFVGDSLIRNQWSSLLCMVQSSIPSSHKALEYHGNLFTFKAKGYNASIDFYWEPFLVESNCDDPYKLSLPISHRAVRVKSIAKHANRWIDSDILIFNSYKWWQHPTMKVTWGPSRSSEELYREEGKYLHYEMALKTWSDWLETHVNRTKTKLFFATVSPAHNEGEDWGKAPGENCYGETEPIWDESYRGRNSSVLQIMKIVEATINELKTRGVKVQILNITHLSDYRKDAHSSIYRKQFVPLTKVQLSNPKSYSDCVHWCVPGVPDVWNTILYAHLVHCS